VAALDEEKAFFQQDIVGPFFVFFPFFLLCGKETSGLA